MTAVALGTLRLGTRRSALALAQSGLVADALRAAGHEVDLVEVVTEGDRSHAAVAEIGSTGVFVTELRQRLLAGDVDVAVHSLKDLPTAPADGIVMAAVPPRADPRDALVARDGLGLSELADGARVGTGSPRRTAQLRALGFGLEIVPIRGNVDSRLRRVERGRARRRRAGRRRAAAARRARRGQRDPRPRPAAARTGAGRAGDRVPRR